MAAPFTSSQTLLVQKGAPVLSLVFGAVGLAAAAALAMGLIAGTSHAFVLLAYAFLAAAMLAMGYALLRTRPVPGRVEAGDHGLSFEGELLVARGQIAGARVAVRDGATFVHVERRLAADIVIQLTGVEPARALVRALSERAERDTPSFRVRPGAVALRRASLRAGWASIAVFAAIFPIVAGAFALHLESLALWILPVWLVALGGILSLPLVRTRIEVGHDGLFFSWCGSTRFVPYMAVHVVYGLVSWQMDALSLARPAYEGVRLVLASGEVVELRSGESEHVYHLIAEAVDAWWRREGSVKAALVQRGPREPQAWLRELQSIGARAAQGYRNASMAEELWRVVADVTAPADARAGAAVALRRSLGEEGQSRLRRIASLTAEPKLRFAIDAAAGQSDDAALAAALADLGEEGSPREGRRRRA